jgi:chemotaxis protein CheD
MEVITVGVGDCRVSNDPGVSLVTHALGSCIAVAVHDPVAGVGGLLHFLLPEGGLNAERARVQPFLFADTGIPELFHQVYAQGGDRRRLSVRLVGGARVLDPDGFFHIGRKNYAACRQILGDAGFTVQAEAVGGAISRTVRLAIGSGELWWSSGGGQLHSLPQRAVQGGGLESEGQ